MTNWFIIGLLLIIYWFKRRYGSINKNKVDFYSILEQFSQHIHGDSKWHEI